MYVFFLLIHYYISNYKSNLTSILSYLKKIQTSKVPQHDSSDDDALYWINSDFDSDDIEEGSENDESELSFEEAGDEGNTADLKQEESWSGKILKSNLPYYDGKLKLSNNFESKIPPNSSPIDFFNYIIHQN